MKFISWNVNGLRACVGKGFEESFNALDADFFCLQETKMQRRKATPALPSIPATNRCRRHTASALPTTTPRAE